ncbi:E3 ubiquitin-protein ligase RNF4-like [Impatiens glandulifera]|uniref:E3 ubiquitin-protein ligase RNF4-like n=1 Tax=Impatiens glandulifera TaxID=253017 RepID=UPI001FB0A810|nr:E3 ubiquitin-protein ligase RNF4-like [Impatiens glandulifera]
MCNEETRVSHLALRGYARNSLFLKMTPSVDLNPPPPPPNVSHDQASAQQMQSGIELLVPQIIDVDSIDDDDDVVISSAQAFAEATKNSRANRRKIVIDLDSDEGTLPGLQMSTVINYYQHVKKEKPKPKPKPVFCCPVCMDSLKNEMSTKCGHIFCMKCIKQTITVQGKCPTCRQRITMKDTFKIYLPVN